MRTYKVDLDDCPDPYHDRNVAYPVPLLNRLAVRLAWALVALMLVAVAARGDEPFVAVYTPPQLTKPKIVVTVAAKPANIDDAVILWDVEPTPDDLTEDGATATWTPVEGQTYKFRYACKEPKKKQVTVRGTVTAGKPAPPPDPPRPPPDPFNPPAKPAAFVVVEETADAADYRRGEFFTDDALRVAIAAGNLKYEIVDKDVLGPDGQPPAHLKGYLAKASGKKLPQLFVVDEKGKPLFSGDLPATPAAFAALLKKLGGK